MHHAQPGIKTLSEEIERRECPNMEVRMMFGKHSLLHRQLRFQAGDLFGSKAPRKSMYELSKNPALANWSQVVAAADYSVTVLSGWSNEADILSGRSCSSHGG